MSFARCVPSTVALVRCRHRHVQVIHPLTVLLSKAREEKVSNEKIAAGDAGGMVCRDLDAWVEDSVTNGGGNGPAEIAFRDQ